MSDRCPIPPDPTVGRFLLWLLAGSAVAMLLFGALCVALLEVACGAEPVPSKVFQARPERVVDGDTVVYPQGVCRLIGVDAPEVAHGGHPGGHPAQPMGDQAAEGLRGELVQGMNTVVVYGTDKYGRMLCAILDHAGYLANLWLVESGLAETYLLDRAPFARGLAEAQARAKAERRGIWGLERYERPSDYRKRMKARE